MPSRENSLVAREVEVHVLDLSIISICNFRYLRKEVNCIIVQFQFCILMGPKYSSSASEASTSIAPKAVIAQSFQATVNMTVNHQMLSQEQLFMCAKIHPLPQETHYEM